jgi:hypothetical protein
MVVSYDRSLDDGFKSVYFRFTYSAVGETTIETPIWVEELTPATPVSATRSQGDTSTTTRVESGKPGERTATARTPVPTPPNATGE